ncbi:MAG: glycosyltransferase family 2 protein [Bacteroidales bacterium]|nr:glycosyltransferase family 2 protein [Bacteroidales bacterium]
MINLSVVIPVFNEEKVLDELVGRLNEACETITPVFELIFVNDGSSDGTLQKLRNFAETNKHIRYISFSRNFGHQNAVMAGIIRSRGNAVVLIDGDLQDPPELIPELYAKFREGFKVVYAQRNHRKGESLFKKLSAGVFYRTLKKITSIDIPLDTGDFRLISREVVNHLISMDESSKFLRGQIAWLGFRQISVEFDRQERKAGKTKYTFRKMMRFAMDGITSFSNFPLQIATFLGFLFSVIAFFIILYALYSKFILEEVVTGWTSIMISSMFIGGVQLLCIGIIGEYISRIAVDVKKRPSFVIEETNCDQEINSGNKK